MARTTMLSKDEAELNFFYMHFHDARSLVEKARSEPSKLKSLYARHSIVSTVFAAEALINRVFDDFYIPKPCDDGIARLPTTEKWIIAPLLCGGNSNQTFARGSEPFQSFLELFKIRNWLLHPKPGYFLPAKLVENGTIETMDGCDVPWVEVLYGSSWPQTKIPYNPFELDAQHAEKAQSILDDMLSELMTFLSEQISDTWLWGVSMKREGVKITEVTTDSLWGGYSPDDK